MLQRHLGAGERTLERGQTWAFKDAAGGTGLLQRVFHLGDKLRAHTL